MAQTGSGKTAAFSLPLLQNLAPELKAPQILVPAPTRQLAAPVAYTIPAFSHPTLTLYVVPLHLRQRHCRHLPTPPPAPTSPPSTPRCPPHPHTPPTTPPPP
ncbi:DEAD/DEAH box helicase, partial [Escherichia coli]|uniref:DEAD/DEAH box helicase n=1 Tax=Escherichia coli TaxID=562 RepID=UPI0035E4042A